MDGPRPSSVSAVRHLQFRLPSYVARLGLMLQPRVRSTGYGRDAVLLTVTATTRETTEVVLFVYTCAVKLWRGNGVDLSPTRAMLLPGYHPPPQQQPLLRQGFR